MYFIGIDLAWSEKNPSAIAILDDTPQLLELKMCITNQEILDFIHPYLDHPSVSIGIDAPLIIPNESGQRDTEKAFLKDFSRYKLGAHAINRNLMLRYGNPIRSETLYTALAAMDFSMNPNQDRFCCEVYPHATILTLFNHNKVLPYKKKPNRSWEEVKTNLTFLQRSLARKIDSPVHEIFTLPCHDLRPKELKGIEDRLDSIVCAYTLWYWHHHRELCNPYGNEKSGLLITPKPLQKHINMKATL